MDVRRTQSLKPIADNPEIPYVEAQVFGGITPGDITEIEVASEAQKVRVDKMLRNHGLDIPIVLRPKGE